MNQHLTPDSPGAKAAREIYAAAKKRWLAQPGGDYSGLEGILLGVIATRHPELLIEAAAYADQFGSVDRLVAERVRS